MSILPETRRLRHAQNPEEARPKSRPLGVCSEVTMSLQSGSRQSPTSSRGVPSLPKPKPRSIRNCPFSPEAEAPFDPRPHLGAEAPRYVPVQNRDSVQVGDPPEGFSPVTSWRLGSSVRSYLPPKRLVVRSGLPLLAGGHRFPGQFTETVSRPPCSPSFRPSNKREPTDGRVLLQPRRHVGFRDVRIVFAITDSRRQKPERSLRSLPEVWSPASGI